jgi:hypothetical protein
VTVRILSFPPPEGECLSDADVSELARFLPMPPDPAEAVRIEALGGRIVDSAAYCQTGAERLR